MRRLAACEYVASSGLQAARIKKVRSRISNLVHRPENAQTELRKVLLLYKRNRLCFQGVIIENTAYLLYN